MEAYPSAVKVRDDKKGRLPLHIACIHTASAQVLKILLERHEESLRTTDKADGRLPLHFACMYGSPFEISLLVGAEQRALVFKDSNGKTPMDLAQESENPHREAILKRLEDRTRVVTSAMIQRRKQQQQDSPSEQRRSLRKSASMRKSTSHSPMPGGFVDSEEPTKFGPSSKRRSISGASSSYDKKKNRAQSSSKSVSTDQRRQKYRARSHTMDDSDIGKKSKSSKKKRHHRASTKNEEWRTTMPAKPVPPTEDIDMTPKLKNGRAGLMSSFKAESSDGSRHDRRKRKSKEPNQLAMFLQATTLDSSSDEEGDYDLRSVGAKSLPALMHSSTLSKPPRRHGEEEGKRRLAKSYMFDTDSSDDLDQDVGSDSFKAFHLSDDRLDTASSGSGRKGHGSGHEGDERIQELDVRRTALSQECQSIHATIAKKEDDAQQSRETIAELQQKIAEYQERLRREQAALTLSETGIQLQKETMAVHEIKIKAVDSEKASLARERLEAESLKNGASSD